jgi:hypothetical protein
MAKLTLNDLTNLQNESSAVAIINNNNNALEVALENTLSRDGTTPNTMSASLDMNSNTILNLPAPSSDTEPLRLGDLPDILPTVIVQNDTPATTFTEGTLWIDSNSSNNDLYQLTASAWVDTTVDLKGSIGLTGEAGDQIFVQNSAPATTGPEGSIWIDADSTDLDLYVLTSAVWVDSGVNIKGTAGAGSGDVLGPASSIDNEIALFSGTGGKTIKRASTTGLLKATSGVIAAAVSSTDYAPATSGSAILKGNGSGGFSTAVAGTDYYNPGGTDVAIADGGTGQSTAILGFNALSPVTTLGDIIYRDASNNVRLAGSTSASKQFLTQTGNGTVSAAPAWGTVSASDVGSGAALTKTDDTNVTLTLGGSPTTSLLTASSLTLGWTGQLGVSRGGTGLSGGTSGGVPYYSGASTLASSAALTQNGIVLGGGAGATPTSTSAGTNSTFLGGNTGSAPTFKSASDVAGAINSGLLVFGTTGINANSANTDYPITISLPTGFTKYIIFRVQAYNPSTSMTTATGGVFSEAGGTGTTIVTNAALSGLVTNTPGANQGAINHTVVNVNSFFMTDTTLFYRIGTAQGSAATFDAVIIIFPVL